jgi:hypothetical protein
MKFCANLGKSATEILTLIMQAFGEESINRLNGILGSRQTEKKSDTREE